MGTNIAFEMRGIMLENLLGAGALILVLAFFVMIPIMIIWSLNVLFGLHIILTFKTWAATLLLSTMVYGSSSRSK